ncbi:MULTISPECIES: hypothetical protein [Mycobacteriaceae]|uniref:Uncharacterized protein n=1 Tax=Mycolicibacter arupensis TaxID=342002 RepID=A0A5C7Y4Z4_9MYCO|nr:MULTISPECIES: hypothetical protein [Mycobacteriaceae]TXI56683.1 MAG: hypothetical protein E6Q54_09920 [Mycolicibacter arupensis]
MLSPSTDPLMTLRTAVVLIGGLLIGVAAGALTYCGTKKLATAVLAGGSAFGVGVVWLHTIIAA